MQEEDILKKIRTLIGSETFEEIIEIRQISRPSVSSVPTHVGVYEVRMKDGKNVFFEMDMVLSILNVEESTEEEVKREVMKAFEIR